jgi:hypothetical protein
VDRRTASALLWGAVGALAFPTLALGYRLAVGPLGLSPVALAAGSLVVGAVVTGLAYALEEPLLRNGRT